MTPDNDASKGQGQAERAKSDLLPANMTAKEFGKVYVQRAGNEVRVEFVIWTDSNLERWQTGVALDASWSMKGLYGRNFVGSKIPPDVLSEYHAKKWLVSTMRDGRKINELSDEACQDALQKGYLRYTDNVVEPLARDFIGYLARELDTGGGVSVIYWACGDGSAFEVIGSFTEEQCGQIEILGPQKTGFGTGTHLAPAMKYFLDTFAGAERAMYIFITDGRIDDLENVKRLSTRLAKDVEAKKRNEVKCVLIGVGNRIDESQMEELDDLDTGTDVDIWDHKIAQEMRALSEIMVELADENKIVAPTATVYDMDGNVVARFADGLPAKATFVMPATSTFFELEAGGQRVRQSVVQKD